MTAPLSARPGDEDTAPEHRPWAVTSSEIARLFHEAYERLAPQMGYSTRDASAVPWEKVSQANRDLMVATAAEVRAKLLNEYAAPSVPPQPTVPRAPVEALLAVLGEIDAYSPQTVDLATAVAEVRRHLNGDTT